MIDIVIDRSPVFCGRNALARWIEIAERPALCDREPDAGACGDRARRRSFDDREIAAPEIDSVMRSVDGHRSAEIARTACEPRVGHAGARSAHRLQALHRFA